MNTDAESSSSILNRVSLTSKLIKKGFKSSIRNRSLTKKTKDLALKIVQNMLNESTDNCTMNLDKVHDRIVSVTKIPKIVLYQILKETDSIESGLIRRFYSQNKRIRTPKTDSFNWQDIAVVRKIIQQHIINEHCIPSVQHILSCFIKCRKKNVSKSDLKKELKQMGYMYHNFKYLKIIREKSWIKLQRLEFLKQIAKYRANNRVIVYVGALEHDAFIILHAGCQKGFIYEALRCYKTCTAESNFLDKVSTRQFQEYVQKYLIPNLPEKSVVVLKTCHYTSELTENVPKSFSRKISMEKWLNLRNIYFDKNMLKADLYEIIKQHKPKYKTYKIDSILFKEGFDVLRIPAHHSELSALDVLFVKMKQRYAARRRRLKTHRYFDIKKFCLSWLRNLGGRLTGWQTIMENIVKLEETYRENDKLEEKVFEKLDFTGYNSSESESDYEKDDFNDKGDSDEDLVQ